MIKFFRHIRKSLIQENKMVKYFKYAFGEIILVVIGILIALQINNWNEQRIKNNLKYQYTVSMISDLKLDIKKIEEYQNYNKNEIEAMDTLATYIQQEVKDVMQLNDLSFSLNLGILSRLNTSTYEALINSGNADLYKQEIRNELIRHHGYQSSYLKSAELNNSVFYETMNSYLQSAPAFETPWIPNSIRNDVWKTMDKKPFLSSFNALLLQRRFLLRRYDINYKELKKSTINIISILERNI